jgi:D-alanine-D-alanine ligase and related ATP-grasp enzymes
MTKPVKQATYILAYDVAAENGDASAQDVFTQMEAIENALRENDFPVARLAVNLDFAGLKKALSAYANPYVVNLVESLDGADSLQSAFALFLEHWGVPFSGSGSQAMMLSNNKILAKSVLSGNGLPTPACCWLDNAGGLQTAPATSRSSGRWIVKPVAMHASLFMDDASVREFVDFPEMAELLRTLSERHRIAFFAEQFVDGREFNISALEKGEKAWVLPPAEIDFSNLRAGKPRIVGYAAKWEEDSHEYAATVRVFNTVAPDSALAEKLRLLTEKTWTAFGLNGYARVDYRVGETGDPYVLEVNANPSLDPNAGLAAAAREAGLEFGQLCLLICGILR